MKDKLEKHHKKPAYFLVRRLLVVLAIALTVSLSIAIPLAIRAHRTTPQIALVK